MSSARKLALAALGVVMAAAGWYVFVYLYRWEWNRAIVAGVIFLAAEVALLGSVLITRLSTLSRRLDGMADGPPAGPPDERVLRRLRDHAPEPAKPFAWLGRSQTNVFVPVLLGAGVVLSGLAWLVDRLARITAVPTMERSLARRLNTLQPPPGGLLGEAPIDPFRPR